MAKKGSGCRNYFENTQQQKREHTTKINHEHQEINSFFNNKKKLPKLQ